MIIRIKSPTSLLRLNIPEDSTFDSILPSKFNTSSYILSFDAKHTEIIETDKPIGTITGIKNQIMLYATFTVKKDHVERKIVRDQDKLMCNHDSNAMCANCAPLDPWDEKYHKEKEIKYLSFETYKEKNRVEGRVLEMENYKNVCMHGENEKCVKCSGLIYLRPQIYRMTDHVEFDNVKNIEHFLSFYRNTNRQRFGYLIGKYQPYDRIPLGRKARVVAIYEPEQESYPDGFIIKEEKNHSLEYILKELELEVVGIIYTALGHTRDYFLNCLEIKFIADYQNKYPYYNNNKIFNSLLTSIVCTDDDAPNKNDINKRSNIKIEPYQISSQALALLNEEIIEPTTNPVCFKSKRIIVYRETSDKHTVEKKSEPYFPVDYFIVKPTYGILNNNTNEETKNNKSSNNMNEESNTNGNNLNANEDIKNNNLNTNVNKLNINTNNLSANNLNIKNIFFKNTEYFNDKNNSYKKLASFFNFDYAHNNFYNLNLLLRLSKESNIDNLLKSIKFNSIKYFNDYINSDEWKDIEIKMEKYKTVEWSCTQCTFINTKEKYECEMCGLPKE
ncbi:Protein involved in ER translocation [Spraguea lophii 42_110]|uniref:Nuclear protein localization protein 4 n=1 Tax=Spraguea lophii (strain 42_110) TaxID=1358809 RepID=S7XUL0_SPRLO|nr:Protein involved in ER translocation [Spraguea lophii 42_110]